MKNWADTAEPLLNERFDGHLFIFAYSYAEYRRFLRENYFGESIRPHYIEANGKNLRGHRAGIYIRLDGCWDRADYADIANKMLIPFGWTELNLVPKEKVPDLVIAERPHLSDAA